MAKDKELTRPINAHSNLNMSLDQVMAERFGRYAKYIIQNRALPDARDGLKPVQRRILFAMHELKMHAEAPYKKSARVVGEVIGKYHPHGDTSIYEAMVRMAQEWKMALSLIDMHGNKGSIDDDPAAAMRYTEVRLAASAQALLANLDKATVPFAPNFDDTEMEPTVLPALLPNLLVNGARGIAAGYATEMPPHNLGEVISAIIEKIRNPQVRLQTLVNLMPGPDFPTGGIIQGTDGIFKAYERGQGKIVIRAKWTISKTRDLTSVNISEIPFGVIKQKLVKDIDEIRFSKVLDGLMEVRDESDRNGLGIVLEFDPAADVEVALNYLLKKTELQVAYSYNNIAIVNNAPRQLGLVALIDAYLAHQKTVQTKALEFDLAKARRRLEIVEGFMRVADLAEAIIKLIREADNSRQGVIDALQQAYQFTPLQAAAIADLRLYRLSRVDQLAYATEAASLKNDIATWSSILSSEEHFNKYLIDLLKQVKKDYATPRKSLIQGTIERIEVDTEALVRKEEVLIGVSRQGYLKKLAPSEYSKLTSYSLKPGDMLVYYALRTSLDRLLIFTSAGRFATIAVHAISATKLNDLGQHLAELGTFSTEEEIVDVISTDSFDYNLNLVLASSEGKIKRTALSEFSSNKLVKFGVALGVADHEKLIAARISDHQSYLALVSAEGKATHFFESEVPLLGAKARGVIGINLSNKTKALTLISARPTDSIGFITAHGETKLIKFASVPLASRTTQGRLIFTSRSKGLSRLEARIVEPSSAFLTMSENVINMHDFANVAFSGPEHGFKSGGTNITSARIMQFDHLDASWNSPAQSSTNDDVAKMTALESRIDAAVDEINLDDLFSFDKKKP